MQPNYHRPIFFKHKKQCFYTLIIPLFFQPTTVLIERGENNGSFSKELLSRYSVDKWVMKIENLQTKFK